MIILIHYFRAKEIKIAIYQTKKKNIGTTKFPNAQISYVLFSEGKSNL